MAPVLRPDEDRRQAPRLAPADLGWEPAAVLRPGRPVQVLDLSAGGALIEANQPVRPGGIAELQLTGAGSHAAIRAVVATCWVDALGPVRYRARLVFEARLEG